MSSSFFRVSTANMYDSSVRNLSTRQKTLVDLQENLTSGKRVVRPSDDPVAAAQAETTLGDAIGLVQEMRQLMVGAGGGALKNEDRKTYANQIQSLQEQLRDVINRKDTNGIPLLGALGSALQPFTGPLTGSPDYQFIGQPGQASSDSTSIATTVDGHAALMFDPVRDGIYGASVTQAPGSSLVTSAVTTSNRDVLAGAGYELQIGGVTTSGGNTQVQYSLTKNGVAVPGGPFTASAVTGQPIPITITDGGVSVMNFSLQGTPVVGDKVGLQPSPSLMSSIDSAIKGITNATSSTQAAQTVSQALAHMDAGIERLSNIRGYAGELLNRADRITGDQESRSIQLEADRSRAEDLDMLKGISDFQNANVGLEAALKSYAQVQRLSLFNYVNG